MEDKIEIKLVIKNINFKSIYIRCKEISEEMLKKNIFNY